MKRKTAASVLALLGLCLAAVGLRADDASKPTGLRSALIGTWRMASMKIDGQKRDLPDVAITYKHVTPGGFVWLSYQKDSGKIFRAAGGTYTLNGDSYIEKIEYGAGEDFDVVKNAAHSFKCRIEGDTWYHTGKLDNGTSIDEEWVRVRPADANKAP